MDLRRQCPNRYPEVMLLSSGTQTKTDRLAPHAEAGTPVLEARNIHKNFGGLKALDDVSFHLNKGEILGIVGDNGAGKSTLIKTVTGAYRKTSGEILLNGKPVEVENTRRARELGIETVYQASGLVEVMDAPSNLFLGREMTRSNWLGNALGFINRRMMRIETVELLKTLNIEVRNLAAPVRNLSGGQQQSVSVGRAAYWQGKIIILDEPANNIGVDQQRAVLELVERVRDSQGVSFIIISHNMDHIFNLADRVIVMRSGRMVGDLCIADTSRAEVVGLITGATIT
ncbi:MAG: ATP-binding cassette domain-containing protein [Paracoccaceae bacterium]|nr:ATP-binding cassette domain-containing protein [Paracoccaceae bacterium]MDE2914037.1 ATP-binding cassette domain-containing protein [Paracoccaceae bacterium]